MTEAPGTVLILGADGFIGRHLAYGLRAGGWQVIACARNPRRLAAMGFQTLAADLAAPACATVEFWRPQVARITHVVNAAGVLTAPAATYRAVHVTAPEALCSALPRDTPGLLISAVGIDNADTDFARYRRAGEDVAARHGHTILRAGLVLGDTSYGGSSLARALAALPLATPVIGDGTQRFNPVHANDLALAVDALLRAPPPPGVHEIGGSEVVTLHGYLTALRGWMGLAPVPPLRLRHRLAQILGRLGDAMRLGPISATSVAQLRAGVLARPDAAIAALPRQPRGFSEFLAARPAGTQDIWHARLYLMRPLLRLTLALLWLVSGLLGLFLPPESFLPLLSGAPLGDAQMIALARAGGIADLILAALLVRGWRPGLTLALQGALVAGYTLAFSWLAPQLWALPLGGLLKNIPILMLIALSAILERER